MKYCPQCGIPAEDNHLFCVSCGAKFPEYTLKDSAPSRNGEDGAYRATDAEASFNKQCDTPELNDILQDIPVEAPKYKLNYLLLWGLIVASTALLIVIALML